ncbi:MAG: 2-isopropylmalate synthase [Ignavibacteriales bacterium]|nr:2-isopropylmalate synthase [Ignavibacteriales bacterium]
MIRVLDATLREGEQTPGVYFDGHIKLAIADLLDAVGVDVIEAGHPLVGEEIKQAVTRVAQRNLNALVGAHARSVKKDVDLALECGVDFLGIFYCVSDERLSGVAKKDLATAIDRIVEVIDYAKSRNPSMTIRYTPEDTVRSKFENVVEAARAATEAGANVISVADTTGYMIPGTDRNMHDFVSRLKDALADLDNPPAIAAHCHNDRGLALANALDAYRGGAEILDATVLGLGERAGLVDLAQLLVALKVDFGVENEWNMSKLEELYRLVARHAKTPIPHNFPIMGENAFTHCAGVHTHAATVDPLHYQSLDPAIVGRRMEISLDHMSGVASLRYALDLVGLKDLRDDVVRETLERVKELGSKGRRVHPDELPYIVDWVRSHPGETIDQTATEGA